MSKQLQVAKTTAAKLTKHHGNLPASADSFRVKYESVGDLADVLNGKQPISLNKDLLKFVLHVNEAPPLWLIEIERSGVSSSLLINLAQKMDVPTSRLFEMLRMPKATAARKVAVSAVIEGRAGQSAVAMIKLLGQAEELLQNSTAKEAKDFDVMKWFGRWIELPQPALGGRRPSELMDTPTGVAMVSRVLGAIDSGAYQ